VGIIREVIEAAVTAIDMIPDLVLSPAAVSALNTPNTVAERVYSVTMQTENSDKFRDRQPAGYMRYEHSLTVSVLCRIFPNDQINAYKDAIDVEELIIQKMLVQADFPAYRVLYDRTRRSFPRPVGNSRGSAAGEYVLLEIEFSIEQSTALP
jgi:hypothetical protein